MREESTIRIGELADGVRGVSYRPEHLQEDIGPDRTVLLRSTNIQEGQLDFSSIQIVPSYLVKPAQTVQEGDLVVCMSNGSKALVGKAARYSGEYGAPLTVGAFCSVFHPKIETDSAFLRHVFQGEQFRRSIDIILSGSAINNLKNSDVEGISIVGYAPPERAKIAEVLDAIDNAILQTDAEIEKRVAIRLGLLDDLIAVPAQVGLAEAPNILADLVVSISAGCSVNADDRLPSAGEFGVLKTSAVGGGRFQPHQVKAVWKKEEPRLKCPVVKDTVVFNRKNTPELVGGSAYVDQDYPGLFLPDLLWSLEIAGQSDVNPAWVANLMQTRAARAYFTRQATGTSKSMVNISQPLLLNMRLRKLPEQDQSDAMKAVTALQVELDALMSERSKLSSLREGLRDDLLTGRKLVMAIREAAE